VSLALELELTQSSSGVARATGVARQLADGVEDDLERVPRVLEACESAEAALELRPAGRGWGRRP
jgi:hypothetical protein